MAPETFIEIIRRLDDETILRLYEMRLFTDEYIAILKMEAFKRCLING